MSELCTNCPLGRHIDAYWELDGTYFEERWECAADDGKCIMEEEQ